MDFHDSSGPSHALEWRVRVGDGLRLGSLGSFEADDTGAGAGASNFLMLVDLKNLLVFLPFK